MNPDTAEYNKSLDSQDRKICQLLARAINQALPEAETPVYILTWLPGPIEDAERSGAIDAVDVPPMQRAFLSEQAALATLES